MKRTLSLILCISFICTAFVGCKNNGAKVDEVIVQYTTDGKQTSLVEDKTATGTLKFSCYNGGMAGEATDLIDLASRKFRELYPNVELIIERGNHSYEFQDYMQRMATQIMAGDGADVFYVNQADFDVNKAMRSGTLADMTEYFENDVNFNINDFNKGVFTTGQFDNKQYLVPISYNVPLYLTTQSIVEKSGLDPSKCKDYLSFLNELDKALQNSTLKNPKTVWDINSAPIYFPRYSGIKHMDYDTQKASLDIPELKAIYESLQKHFTQYANLESMTTTGISTNEIIASFKNETALFVDFNYSCFGLLIQTFLAAADQGEMGEIFALRDVNSKITADVVDAVSVRSNSKEKQNAYNFIKTLICPQAQDTDSYYSMDIPISNVAAMNFINRIIENHKSYSANSDIDFSPFEQKLLDEYKEIIADTQNTDYFIKGNFVFKDAMRPYLKNEKSYEECIENAKSALDIYLSE